MSEFYEDGQVKAILPYCPNKVDWFIIGGPADANEAQIFKKYHPECKILGIEPNLSMREFQDTNRFPWQLVNAALWSSAGLKTLTIPNNNNRCGSLVKYEGVGYKVETVTLDFLSDTYGPFTNAILWIDIEGSEVECLKGARQLLSSKEIKTINIEIMPETEDEIVTILLGYGYKYAHHWNERETHPGRIIYDMIFNLTGNRI